MDLRACLAISLPTMRALLDYQAEALRLRYAANAHALRTAKRKAERVVPPENLAG